MKFPIVTFFLAISLTAILTTCSPEDQSQSESPPAEFPLDSINLPTSQKEIVPKTLEDTIQEIRSLFRIINNNADAGNYAMTQIAWQDSFKQAKIIEYREKGRNQRKKVMYKSDTLVHSHPLIQATDSFIQITKDYYYWQNKLFFVYEVLTLGGDSESVRKIENRFYFSGDQLIRWLLDKNDMDQQDELYQYFQQSYTENYHLDPLYAYDFATEFGPRKEEIYATDCKIVLRTYTDILKWRYPESDSLEILVYDDINYSYLMEVRHPATSQSRDALYQLIVRQEGGRCAAKEQLIGQNYSSLNQSQTPGDIFYHMLRLVRAQDLTSVLAGIPDEGFFIDETTHIGDVPEPQHEAYFFIRKDSLELRDIAYCFQAERFMDYAVVDTVFSSDGEATIAWYGGGFQEEVIVQKINGKAFAKGFRSVDH